MEIFQIFTFLTSDRTLNEAVDSVDSDFLAGSGAGAACASSALAGSFFSSAGAAGSGLFGCSWDDDVVFWLLRWKKKVVNFRGQLITKIVVNQRYGDKTSKPHPYQ